jgi:type VI secretion system protein ImpE
MIAAEDAFGAAFRQGDLAAAKQAAIEAVKASPRDAGLRWRLAEMFLLSGELERADKALDAILSDSPAAAVLEFRRLLRAETARREVMTQGGVPEFHGNDPTPAQQASLKALTLARAGDRAEAMEAAAAAENLRPRLSGSTGGTPFDDFRDVDDILAPQLEILTTGGAYLWLPTERVASLVLEPMRRPRDIAWRRCNLILRDGTEGSVILPQLYPLPGGTDALRLGRETAWSEGPGPVRGTGLRLWLAGEAAVAVADLQRIDFA